GAVVREACAGFEREFVRPAWDRRATLIESVRKGDLAEQDLTQDILTILLLHRADANLELSDDGRIVREVATYLQGGTHTSAQTLVNALDIIFARADANAVLERIATDTAYAQRVVLETLRLRPTTPKAKRRAEADTEVAGVRIPKDAQVVLDFDKGNRDRSVFGDDADEFDPDRTLAPAVPRW